MKTHWIVLGLLGLAVVGTKQALSADLSRVLGSRAEDTIRFAVSVEALTVKQAVALLSSARISGGVKEHNAALKAIESKVESNPPPAMPPIVCSVGDLPYSGKMKSQILELCAFGLSRSEAIDDLQQVYRMSPMFNPELAVRIVKLGHNIDALRNDPFRAR